MDVGLDEARADQPAAGLRLLLRRAAEAQPMAAMRPSFTPMSMAG